MPESCALLAIRCCADLEHGHKVGELPNEQTSTRLKRLHLRAGDVAAVDDGGTELFDVEDEASSTGTRRRTRNRPRS